MTKKIRLLYLILLAAFGQCQKSHDVISTNITLTRFYLWTRANPTVEQELIWGDLSSISNSNFNSSLPTKVLVHGCTGNGKQQWVLNTRDNYLSQGNYNILSVDYAPLAECFPWYGIAVANIKKIGPYVGQLLRLMTENLQVSANNIHLVGWSLGGQLVAFIGQEMNGTLSRITSLDPAGFLFHTAPPDEKLTRDDAIFVDVIHTAGLWLGTDEPLGHVDFYPNGGQGPQPGCESEDPLGLDCSHERAPDFFIESIISEVGFRGVLCESYDEFEAGSCSGSMENYLGEPALKSPSGTYYLKTNSQTPFALG